MRTPRSILRPAARPARRTLRRLLRSRRGASAVEFALTAPILFLVISGTLDMAQAFYVNTVLQGAVNAAARASTLQSGPIAATTLDSQVTKMVRNVVPKASVTFARKSYSEFSRVGMPEDFTDTNNNGTYNSNECFVDMNGNSLWDADLGTNGIGGANDVVVYTVAVDYKRIFGLGSLGPYLGLPEREGIRMTTILKNQPYTTQTTRTGVSVCP